MNYRTRPYIDQLIESYSSTSTKKKLKKAVNDELKSLDTTNTIYPRGMFHVY